MSLSTELTEFYARWAEWFAQQMEEKMRHRRNREAGTGFYFPPGTEAPGYDEADTYKEYVHVKWKDVQPGAWAAFASGVFLDAWRQGNEWLHARGLDEVNEHTRLEDHVLRVLHYLPHPTGEVGAAHKDFNLLTVNIPGTAPGLEKWSNRAHQVISEGGSFEWIGRWFPDEGPSIHVGEMLEIYTNPKGRPRPSASNGEYSATLHRVRAPANTERFKAVFFLLPPMDFVLRPGGVDDFGLGGHGYRAPFTAHDYLFGPDGRLNRASPGVNK